MVLIRDDIICSYNITSAINIFHLTEDNMSVFIKLFFFFFY